VVRVWNEGMNGACLECMNAWRACGMEECVVRVWNVWRVCGMKECVVCVWNEEVRGACVD
jgi:hypothetical protein